MMLKFQILLLSVLLASTLRAEELPEIINSETGERVNLVRAYWNANVDIANKAIQCEHFEFDDESATFVINSNPNPHSLSLGFEFTPASSYLHKPLPNNLEPINSVLVAEDSNGSNNEHILDNYFAAYLPVWTVSDGVYSGLTALRASRYVELIPRDAFVENAVRIWLNGDDYFECFDKDGQPLLPTGSAQLGNTNLVELSDFTFDFPKAIGANDEYPSFTRLDTGESVELVRGLWSNNSLAVREQCSRFEWSTTAAGYLINANWPGPISAHHPYNGNGYVETVIDPEAPWHTTFTRDLEDRKFIAQKFCDQDRHGACGLELSDNGYRLWLSDSTFYECGLTSVFDLRVPHPIEPLALLPIDPLNCDYSDADNYDGFGWNSVAMVSCPPLTAETPVDNIAVDSDASVVIPANTATPDNSTAVDLDASVDISVNTATPDNSDEDDQTQGNIAQAELTNIDETEPQSGGGSICLIFIMLVIVKMRKPALLCRLENRHWVSPIRLCSQLRP